MHQIQYAVKQGCVRLRNALTCISEAMFTFMKSRVAGLEAAVTTIMASVADNYDEADSPTATSASTTHVELIPKVIDQS